MKIDSAKILKADVAIKNAEIVVDNQYNQVFKGYISSFGASIAQAGLLPTIIFFESKSDKASERPKVIQALKQLLPEEYQVDDLTKHLLTLRKSLKDEYKQKEKELQKQVTEAMVAMKLALRMYSKKGGEGGDNGEER